MPKKHYSLDFQSLLFGDGDIDRVFFFFPHKLDRCLPLVECGDHVFVGKKQSGVFVQNSKC